MKFRLFVQFAVIGAVALFTAAGESAWARSISLNLKGADISAVITTVSDATGKNFIVDPRVKGKVTVVSAKSLDEKELYQVFLTILEVHGFTAVETGDVIKILPDADAKHQTLAQDGKGGEIITQVISVRNISAAQLVPILRPLVPPQGHLAAHAQTNTLIIADHAANIHRLIKIIERIDEPSGAEIEVLQLKHASASEVVRVITTLMQKQKKTDPASPETSIVADERTNSILLGGEKTDRLQIKAIIAHLDTPSDMTGDTHVIYLRYGKAKDLVSVLTGVGQTEAKGQAKGQAPGQQPQFTIQADEASNALVISAPPDIFRSLESVVRKLDVRKAQVIVEAIIAEVSQSKSSDLGVQWFADGSKANLPVAGQNVGSPSLPEVLAAGKAFGTSDTATATALTKVPAGLAIGIGRFNADINFGVLINALAKAGDANLLSTPNIVTMDNQEAEIFVGQNVSIPSGSFTSTGSGSTTSVTNPFTTFKEKQVGIRLKVKPQINEGDAIKLEIDQTVDNITAGQAGSANLVTSQRTIKTSVMVDDGKVVVLGGLISDDENESQTKVPLLGDIPLLGSLFRYKSKNKQKTNLMVFLRPTIMRDGAITAQIAGDKYNYIRAQQMNARDLDEEDMLQLMPTIESLNTPVVPKPEAKTDAVDEKKADDKPADKPADTRE
jgi:general secretion pathway protein D